MPDGDIDQFLHIFLQENSDRFEILSQELVRLEENPYDEELLYSILRHIHSLKGSAGMFGFNNLKQIAHRLEDLMDRVHKTPELVSREVMDTLFEGVDVLQSAFRRIVDKQDTEEQTPRERAFLERLERVLAALDQGGDVQTIAMDLLSGLDELVASFGGVVDFSSLTADAQRLRQALQAGEEKEAKCPEGRVLFGGVDVSAPVRAVFKTMEKAKAAPVGAEEVDAFFVQMRLVIAACGCLTEPRLAELVADADECCDVFTDMDLEFDALQIEYFEKFLADVLPAADLADVPVLQEEGARSEGADGAGTLVQRKTVRIEENKIDKFLDSVGEMIILGEVFNNLQKRLAELSGRQHYDLMREFKTANADFSKQVFQLQSALMDIRRVELRNVTASLSRLIRDTANSLGKKIVLQVEGESAVIDKSLLDDVNACLVHIVRNSCDHGIELPQDRIAAGKPPEGVVRVSAANEEGQLILRVSDDGKGIDLARVKQKALERGICSERELAEMSERQVRELIFHNGLSTADSVSDISGRGVGMSTVLDNINKTGGSLELRSALGEGTEVILRIPLSIMLSVLDGLVVRAGAGGFILPIRNVVETIVIGESEVITYQKKGECIRTRGVIRPLYSLAKYLNCARGGAAETGGARGNIGVVIRSADGLELCLCVDEILDHQQVVIKRIDGLEGVPGILGGSLLGDGTIGLVLNPDYFASLCD